MKKIKRISFEKFAYIKTRGKVMCDVGIHHILYWLHRLCLLKFNSNYMYKKQLFFDKRRSYQMDNKITIPDLCIRKDRHNAD